jgi:hypothetical protein
LEIEMRLIPLSISSRLFSLNWWRQRICPVLNLATQKGEAAFAEATSQEQLISVIKLLTPAIPSCDLIRCGGDEDGAYLLPNDFDGIAGCISPGVSNEIGFDLDMADRGIPVLMLDASVNGPPISRAEFEFRKKFLGSVDSDTHNRLSTLVDDMPSGDLILQMDIEGTEFEVIIDTPQEIFDRFRIMVIEFHNMHWIHRPQYAKVMLSLLGKLAKTHRSVHIHANNCCGSITRHGIEIPRVFEVTYYRLDRGVRERDEPIVFPHPNDIVNVPSNPPLNMSPVWGLPHHGKEQ